MKDRELVKLAKKEDESKEVLYFRYEKLCFKHLHILERQLNHKLEVKDDFMADTYEVFLKALEAVDLSKVKNDKWLFLGWYGFYLKNLRQKYMNEIIKQSQNETSLFRGSDTGDEYVITDALGVYSPDIYEEIGNRLTLDAIYKEFTPRQKVIVDFKRDGLKHGEIAKRLSISNTLVTFEVADIKKKIRSALC